MKQHSIGNLWQSLALASISGRLESFVDRINVSTMARVRIYKLVRHFIEWIWFSIASNLAVPAVKAEFSHFISHETFCRRRKNTNGHQIASCSALEDKNYELLSWCALFVFALNAENIRKFVSLSKMFPSKWILPFTAYNVKAIFLISCSTFPSSFFIDITTTKVCRLQFRYQTHQIGGWNLSRNVLAKYFRWCSQSIVDAASWSD